MSETEPLLLIERQGPIAIVTLNRPDKRNALSEKLWGELKKTFESFEPDVRCVVLAGAGKHFCAGLDLSEHRHREAFESIFMSRFAHATLDAIQFGGRPVVTAMQGAVIGGGLEVATATHVRVADTDRVLSAARGPPRLLCRRRRQRPGRQDHRLRPHGGDDADRPDPRCRGRREARPVALSGRARQGAGKGRGIRQRHRRTH